MTLWPPEDWHPAHEALNLSKSMCINVNNIGAVTRAKEMRQIGLVFLLCLLGGCAGSGFGKGGLGPNFDNLSQMMITKDLYACGMENRTAATCPSAMHMVQKPD